MGMTKVKLTIKSIDNPKNTFVGEFLVDSGAQYTVLPLEVWKKLNIKPTRIQDFSLADGKTITRKIGNAFITFEKEEIPSPVVLGEKNDNALLGVYTLEGMGLGLDPFTRKLYKSHLMM